MPRVIRVVVPFVAGAIAWMIAATAGNLAIRWLLPGYAEVEKSFQFSIGMLIARLVTSAMASLIAGAAYALASRRTQLSVLWFAVLLLGLFIPVHVNLWDKFPVWYHVVFLGSLAPLAVIGARWAQLRGARVV